mmetsp:Transcript_13418/g.15373  ORF Transcript_13418/g.15373 Transcript_13418/m.15373 type:complete len:143 (-) Transcript_13418:204-632(-)
MVYTKFVELGRVVSINYGNGQGKLAVIIDVLNERRVLIDGPTLGVDRQLIPVKRISLTKFKLPIMRNPRSGSLKKAIETFGLKKKWEETPLAKRIASKTRRATLNDFERFKTVILRKQLAKKVRKEAKKVVLGGGKQAPKKK